MKTVTKFIPADEVCQILLDGSHAILRTLDGTIVAWTAGACQLYGWASEEVIGTQEHEVLHTSFPAPLEQILGELRLQGRWAGELRQKKKDGSDLLVQSVWVLSHGDGSQYVVENNADLTHLIGSRERLLLSEQRLLLAQQAACLGTWDRDLRQNTVECSPEWFAIHGRESFTPGPSYSQWLAWLHPEDRARAFETMRGAMENGSPYQAEFRVIWPDGSVHWLQARAQILRDEFGNPVRIIGANLDITSTKSLELKLKSANCALERSIEDLHQFTYAAGHDLKEPLRAVSSYAALLARRLPKPLTSETQAFLSSIEDGAIRMQTMIDSLLEYAHTAEQASPVGRTSAADAVSDALMNLHTAINESAAEVVIGDLPELTANGELLTQVFQNLIGNAIKYRRPDEPPRIRISAAQTKSEWIFAIADNGAGFDPRHSERIFQLFSRVEDSSKTSGSGIGLAICKRIVERDGGRIWADSRPGKGSTFYFSIPEPKTVDNQAKSARSGE